jgi:hypothetical protein
VGCHDSAYQPAVPLAASDERVIVRRSAARHDRAVDAARVLPPELRHAGYGLISLPRLSAYGHDDVTVVSLRGELDLSGTAVLHAQLRDIRWRARSVAGLTGLRFPRLRLPQRACQALQADPGTGRQPSLGGPLAAAVRPVLPVIGLLTWSRRTTAPGTPPLALGAPITVFPAAPVQPPIAIRGATARISAVKSAIGAGLRERGSVRRRRPVQPRHAHDHILGVHQRAAIFPPCPASGQRRSSF